MSTKMDFRRITALLRMSFNEFRRDFGSVFLSLLFPLFFVASLVATNLVNTKVTFDVGLVDAHHNPDTTALGEALASANIAFRTLDEPQARRELQDGKLQAVIIVPANSLARGAGRVQVLAEQRYAGFATMMLDAARARLVLDADRQAGPYGFHLETFEAQADSNFAFLYPGMLALALLQLGLFSTATPLLKARERGTLRYLLLTPLTVGEMLIGQIALRVLVAFAQITILLVAGMIVINISVSDWLAVYAVSLLGVAMLVAIGYALAGLPRSLESGMAMVMIANFAMMFGGNIFWDPSSATVLKVAAHLFPVSYLADIYRQLISDAQGLWPIWVDLLALVLWTGLALALAVKTFAFDMRPRERAATT